MDVDVHEYDNVVPPYSFEVDIVMNSCITTRVEF